MYNHILRFMYGTMGVLFALAAGAKLASHESTITTLMWFGLSSHIAQASIYLLVICELALAIGLIGFPNHLVTRWGGLLLLATFTLALAVMYFSATAPSCGCMGLVKMFQNQRSEVLFGISRNLLLIALLTWDVPSLRRPQSVPAEPIS